MTDEKLARRLLEALYPAHDSFIRRRTFSWSAEIVDEGQSRAPYRTSVIAEAATLAEVAELLVARCEADGVRIPTDCLSGFIDEQESVGAVDPVGGTGTEGPRASETQALSPDPSVALPAPPRSPESARPTDAATSVAGPSDNSV